MKVRDCLQSTMRRTSSMKKLLCLVMAALLLASVLAPMAVAEKDNWLHIFLTDDP